MPILDQYGKPFPVQQTTADERLRQEVQRLQLKNREMRAKVDAASTDEFSTRLWANADSLGPNAAFNEGVRQRVRDRGRYENINNGNARGLIRAHSSDLIGTCPRPQLTIPGDEDGTMAEKIERSFMKWGKAIQLGFKSRLLEKQRGHSGDGLAILIDNPKIKHKVKLDWLLVEAEQLCTPWGTATDASVIDGIKIDQFGNRIAYYFLKQHPGESRGPNMSAGEFEVVKADNVIHWYEQDRPGQLRGLARIASALPIFGQVRRWDAAKLTAAEFASMLAGIMHTNIPVQDGQPVQVDQWEFFEMIKGALMSLPQGWKAEQFKSEQPAPDNGFKRQQLNEAGRGSGAPLNITTGNSSEYNYSSARCDLVPWKKEKRIERYDFNTVALDPTLIAWEEAARMVGEVPAEAPAIEEWDWVWHFDGFEGIDPQKDAQTDDMRLKNGTADFAEIHGEYGDDSRAKFKKLVKEIRAFEAEGLVHPYVAATKAPPAPAAETPPPEDEEEAESTLRNRIKPHLNGHGLNGVHHD